MEGYSRIRILADGLREVRDLRLRTGGQRVFRVVLPSLLISEGAVGLRAPRARSMTLSQAPYQVRVRCGCDHPFFAAQAVLDCPLLGGSNKPIAGWTEASETESIAVCHLPDPWELYFYHSPWAPEFPTCPEIARPVFFDTFRIHLLNSMLSISHLHNGDRAHHPGH